MSDLVQRLRDAVRDTLGEHLELIRSAGEGGMGVVYEAVDRQSGRRLAVKVLSWSGKCSLERFHREAGVLEKLGHPAIVSYVAHGTTAQGQPYLAMQWLDGESLAVRITRGRLDLVEVAALGERIAAALAEAHDHGIVHRDVKPSNILLCDGHAANATLIDFGIAHMVDRADPITATGQMVGTLGYIAPEQARGAELDGRADLFALGCVLYEALTAERAFPASGTLMAIAEVLTREPAQLRALRPDVPERLEALVEALLDKDVRRRPQAARDVAVELAAIREALERGDRAALAARHARWPQRTIVATDRAQVDVEAPTLDAHVPRRRRWLVPLLVASGFAVAATTFALVRGHTAATQPAKSRGPIAVLAFRDEAGVGTLSGTVLANTLRRDLEASRDLEIVSGEVTQQVARELDLAAADTFSAETLHRVQSLTGARLVVVGSFLSAGTDLAGDVRVAVRILDCTSGAVTPVFTDHAPRASLLDLLQRAGARTRAALGARALTHEESELLRAAQPPTPAAARLLAVAREHLGRNELDSAIARLEDLLKVDPDYAPARRVLAEALYKAGYELRSRAEAERALRDAKQLPDDERLEIEAYYKLSIGKDVEAAQLYKGLAARRTCIEPHLRLAQVLGYAGAYDDAWREIAAATARWPDDARVDLQAAVLARRQSDYGRMQAAADRAEQKARAAGSTFLRAEAKLRQAELAVDRGELAIATESATAARDTFAIARDPVGECDAKEILGTILSHQGKLAAAKQLYVEMLASYQRSGSLRGQADAYQSLGWMAYQLGDLENAERSFTEEERLFTEADNEDGVALAKGQRARLAFERDELALAEQLWTESAAIHRRTGRRKDLAQRLSALGELALSRGDLATAREHFTEQAALRDAIGRPIELGLVHLDQARLALAEGKHEDAERAAREALGYLETARSDEESAHARLLLVSSLLARRDLPAATRELDALARPGTERAWLRLELAIASARLDEARGKRAAACAVIDRTVAALERLGMKRRARETVRCDN